MTPEIHQEFNDLRSHLLEFVYGKQDVANVFEIALLMKGHILIEDFP